MLPKWLLPGITELPEMTVKGTHKHGLMLSAEEKIRAAKAIAITRYNERVKEEKRLGIGTERRKEMGRIGGLARWKNRIPKL